MKNIANTYCGVKYAKYTNHDFVIMQNDITKTFVTIQWSFVEATMHTIGFNHKMSKVSHRLYNNSIVTCILDAEMIDLWTLFNMVMQGW